MSGILTKKELHALMLVGGRQTNERSRALPRQAYMDPSRSVLFESERAERRAVQKERAKFATTKVEIS